MRSCTSGAGIKHYCLPDSYFLQTLQQSLAAKTEEARYLVQELSGAQQRLRSLRDAASALLLGAATGRNNSPCRDNTFDRR